MLEEQEQENPQLFRLCSVSFNLNLVLNSSSITITLLTWVFILFASIYRLSLKFLSFSEVRSVKISILFKQQQKKDFGKPSINQGSANTYNYSIRVLTRMLTILLNVFLLVKGNSYVWPGLFSKITNT